MITATTNTGAPQRAKAPWVDRVDVAWAILGLGFLGLGLLVFTGWFPHDDGTLAQAASRVLRGELPHVDFHDTYGGLQAMVHAAVFELVGESLRSLRFSTLMVAAVGAVSVFHLVRRVQAPVVAATSGVAAFMVGFAAYPASMPTWWNAALGCLAVLCCLKWTETSKVHWLVVAGVATGVSFLVKMVAAYVAAALVLYVVVTVSRTRWDRVLSTSLGILTGIAFLILWTGFPRAGTLITLVIPILVTVGVGVRQSRLTVSEETHSAAPAFASLIVFLASMLAPIVAFVSFYALRGGAVSLVRGWFLLPGLRFESATQALKFNPLLVLVISALGGMLLASRKRWFPFLALAVVVALGVVAVLEPRLFWETFLTGVVVSPLITSVLLARIGWNRRLGGGFLLLGLVYPMFAFIVFPFTNKVYLLYLIPMAVAMAAHVVPRAMGKYLAATFVTLSVFVGAHVAVGDIYLGFPTQTRLQFVDLDVERGGIRIPTQLDYYNDMIEHLEEYEGTAIYAGPDAPEVYFLSGAENPTPVLFDFLAESWDYDAVVDLVESGELSAVVVNREPRQSNELPTDVVTVILDHYPHVTRFGRFDVYEVASHDE